MSTKTENLPGSQGKNQENTIRNANLSKTDSMANHSKISTNITSLAHYRTSLISQLSGSPCDTYIDTCGVCNGKGQSRVDQCNVCGGDNRCISCDSEKPKSKKDSCGKCLLPQDDSWNDCWSIVQVVPTVLDAALGSESELKLELTKPPSEKMDIICTAIQGNLNLVVNNINLDENWLNLKVVLLPEIGELQIQCQNKNKSHSWGMHNITVVNSHGLSISSVTPTTIYLGTSTQMRLTVHGISAMLDLFCYLKDTNNSVIFVTLTYLIAGNSMSSTVSCPHMIIPHESANIVGVSYTRQAVPKLMNNSTIKLSVQPSSIKPLQAYFSKDYTSLNIDFNQNVDGPSDCSGIFRPTTLNLLGKGTKCRYLANKMTVKLGSDATIQPRNVIRLSSSLSLRQYGSSSVPTENSTPQKGFFIKLKPSQDEVLSYKLVGPEKLCLSSTPHVFKVLPVSAKQLRYNWSLEVSAISSVEDSSQKQRKNLVTWLGAREIIRPTRIENLNQLRINSSLLVPGVMYKLEVVGYNSIGAKGKPASLYFQLLNSDPKTQRSPKLMILSPREIEINTPLYLEAKVLYGCGNQQKLNSFKFSWELVSSDTSKTLETNAAKAEIPSGILKTPNIYNITCTLFNGSTVLAKDTVQVSIKTPKPLLNIVPRTITLSTEHSLELDATKSWPNLDISLIKVKWFCKMKNGQSCITPKSNQLISSIYKTEFDKLKLILPAGSLHIGRFDFTLEVSNADSITSSHAEVYVIEGNTPKIFLSTATTSPTFSIFIPATVAGSRIGCLARWQSVPFVGYQYISLNNLSRSERIISSSSTQDMSLIIPAEFLSPGVKYRVQLSVYCSAREFSQASIDVILQSPPEASKLEVTPVEGTALKTEFTFLTESRNEMDVVSFGWYSESGSPYFFFVSPYSSTARTTLPCFKKLCQVNTILKVCNSYQVCSLADGPVIKTSLPTSLTTQEIDFLSKEFTSTFSSGGYQEATTSAVALLSTTHIMNNQTAYNKLSSVVKETILQEINHTSSKLERTPSLRSRAMMLLDCVTKLLPLLKLNDTALSIIVSFRDIIADTSHILPAKSIEVLRTELILEPRNLRVKRQQSIPPNTAPETADNVLVWLKTSETAILNFSPEKSAEERQKLMNNLDDYAAALCKGVDDFHSIYLESQIVNLSVQKLSVGDNMKTSLSLPSCSNRCKKPTAQIILGKSFGNKYKTAETICFSGLQFPKTSLDLIFKPPIGKVQLSDVFRMKVLTYTMTEDNPMKDTISVSIGIPIPTLREALNTYQIEVGLFMKTVKNHEYNSMSVFCVALNTTALLQIQ